MSEAGTGGRRALVIGGGGVAGIAWATGVLAGLAEAGAPLDGADRLFGTSAGAAVVAQLGSGTAIETLFARQVDPALQAPEILPEAHLNDGFMDRITALIEAGDGPALARGMGEFALATATIDEARRRDVVARRLPSHDWPAIPLTIVAVDAATGEARLFDRDSGVPLVDAVAASCAVPGVWPPTTIGAHRYIDGGVRSVDNADLAAGFERIVILSPRGTRLPFVPGYRLLDQVALLEAQGSAVQVIEPDKPARQAIGRNSLDPGTRFPAADAGRTQGRAIAPTIATFWPISGTLRK